MPFLCGYGFLMLSKRRNLKNLSIWQILESFLCWGLEMLTVNILGTNKELYKTVGGRNADHGMPASQKTSRPIWLQIPKAKVRKKKLRLHRDKTVVLGMMMDQRDGWLVGSTSYVEGLFCKGVVVKD